MLKNYFILRWTLANSVGWALGLYIGSGVWGWLGGIPGLLVGGGIIGGVVGACQWWAFQMGGKRISRRWIYWSIWGGVLAIFPVFLLSFTTLFGLGFAGLLMGALFGGLFGGMQALYLSRQWGAAIIGWLLINIVAGAICGSLTLMNTANWLPLICTPGPLLFGLLTGWLWHRLYQP